MHLQNVVLNSAFEILEEQCLINATCAFIQESSLDSKTPCEH